jgi:hypothetical protein
MGLDLTGALILGLLATTAAVFFAGRAHGRRVEAQSWCRAAKALDPPTRLSLLEAYKRLQGWS